MLLPCSMQNYKTIWRLKWMLWSDEISPGLNWRWIWKEYTLLPPPIGWIMYSLYYWPFHQHVRDWYQTVLSLIVGQGLNMGCTLWNVNSLNFFCHWLHRKLSFWRLLVSVLYLFYVSSENLTVQKLNEKSGERVQSNLLIISNCETISKYRSKSRF